MSMSSLYIVQFLIKSKELLYDRVKQQTNELVAYNSTTPNHWFFPLPLKRKLQAIVDSSFYRHLTKLKI